MVHESVKFNFSIYRDNEKINENSLILINNKWHITAGFEKEENNVDLEYFVPKSLLNIVNKNLVERQELIINTPLSSISIS